MINKILVFTTGVAAGAVVGALYAPHKGKITRNMIRNRVNENRDLATEKIHELKTQISF